MVPITWNLADCTQITHDQGKITIHANGECKIEGPIKDAAIGLFYFIIEQEYNSGLVSIEINKCLRVDLSKNFEVEWLGQDKPEYFDELVQEFKRVTKMKAFW